MSLTLSDVHQPGADWTRRRKKRRVLLPLAKAIGDGYITEKERQQRRDAARASAEARRRNAGLSTGPNITDTQRRLARLAGYTGAAIGGLAGGVTGGGVGSFALGMAGSMAGQELFERGALSLMGSRSQTYGDRWKRFKTGAADSQGAATGASLGSTAAWLGNRLISNRTGGFGGLVLRDIGLQTAGGALGAEVGRAALDRPPNHDWRNIATGLGGLALGIGAYRLGTRGSVKHLAPLQRQIGAGMMAGTARYNLMRSTAIPRFAIGGMKMPRIPGFASPRVPQPARPNWWAAKPTPMLKRDLSPEELEQRREAARARWNKHRASAAADDDTPRDPVARVRDTVVTLAPVALAGLVGLGLYGLSRGRGRAALGQWKDKAQVASRALFRAKQKNVIRTETALERTSEKLMADRKGWRIKDVADNGQIMSSTALTDQARAANLKRQAKLTAELKEGGRQSRLRGILRERMSPNASEGIRRQRANEIARGMRKPDIEKRLGDGVITEAEREQRRAAAKARWERHARNPSADTKPKVEAQHTNAETEPTNTGSGVRDNLVVAGLGALALGGAYVLRNRHLAGKAAAKAADLARSADAKMVRSSLTPTAERIENLGRKGAVVGFLSRAMSQGGPDLALAAQRVKAAQSMIGERLAGLKNSGGHIFNQPDAVRGPSRFGNEFSGGFAGLDGSTTGTRGADADLLMRMRQTVGWAGRAIHNEQTARLAHPGKSLTTPNAPGQTSAQLEYLAGGLRNQALGLRDNLISSASRLGYTTTPMSNGSTKLLRPGEEFKALRENRTPRGTSLFPDKYSMGAGLSPDDARLAGAQLRRDRTASYLAQQADDKDIFDQGARAGRRFRSRMAERAAYQLQQRGGYTIKPTPFAGMEAQLGGLGNMRTTRPVAPDELLLTRWLTPARRSEYAYSGPDLLDRNSLGRRGRFNRSE